MRKIKFSNKEHLQAEMRNKLTLPLAVLNAMLEGEAVSRENIRLAINDIKKIVKLLDARECQ